MSGMSDADYVAIRMRFFAEDVPTAQRHAYEVIGLPNRNQDDSPGARLADAARALLQVDAANARWLPL